MSAFHRLATLWSGLPTCSVVVFRHLQKTGGTSIVKVFEDFQRDLQWSVEGYWSPCWQGRGTHVAHGRLRLLRGLRMLASAAAEAGTSYSTRGTSHQYNGTLALAAMSASHLDAPPWPRRHLLHVHHPDAKDCGGLPALQMEVDRLRPVAHSLACHVVVAMLYIRQSTPPL